MLLLNSQWHGGQRELLSFSGLILFSGYWPCWGRRRLWVRIVASEGLDHCRPADSLRMSHFESENFFPKQTVLSFFHSLCLRVNSSCPCGSGQHRVWAVQAAMAAAQVCAVLAGFLYFSGTGCDVPHEDFPGHVTA